MKKNKKIKKNKTVSIEVSKGTFNLLKRISKEHNCSYDTSILIIYTIIKFFVNRNQ